MFLLYKVKVNDKYFNIHQVLKEEFNMSDRLILKLKKRQRILLNNNLAYINHTLSKNDLLKIDLCFDEDNSNIVPTKMDLNIIYEDDYYLIINKPPKIAIHPSLLHYNDSLSNGVKYYFDSINLNRKIRPVNRLDRDTTGLVIFAKNDYIQECLVKQMKSDTFKKEYLAICKRQFQKLFWFYKCSYCSQGK